MRSSNDKSANRTRGQAVIMVTLALIALCGLLGLAVDLGWGYFVKRAAQSAADSAALAAVRAKVSSGGVGLPCSNGGVCRMESAPFVCTSSVVLDSTDNLTNGCLYARQNGYENAGRRTVRIFENSGTGATIPVPSAPGVEAYYYATVQIAESIPQLFSAILGNTEGIASARATAAVVESQTKGSLILLNRDDDIPNWGGGNARGVNLDVAANTNQGLYSVDAAGGILMASGCAGGGGCNNNWAGNAQGSSRVRAPFTFIRQTGDIPSSAYPKWDADPVNGHADGADYWDPTRGKPQIPLTTNTLPICPVIGGTIGDGTTSITLGPGRYYSYDIVRGVPTATLQPIRFDGPIRFGSGGSCFAGSGNANGFGDYVMFGGVDVNAGTLSFDPGRYVIAGVQQQNNNSAGVAFKVTNGDVTLQSSGSGPTYSGEVFIYTDASPNGYPGLGTHINDLNGNIAIASQDLFNKISNNGGELKQGQAGFRTGNNNRVNISLDGLNADGAGLPPELKKYAPAVIWQDRRNSFVRYNADGTIACGDSALGCAKNNSQQAADNMKDDSPEFFFQASPTAYLRGGIYQPRGAWAKLVGGGQYNAPLQIVTGAMRVQGNANVILQPVTTTTFTRSVVALVE